MPQPANLSPGAYEAEGGPVGALLIHGFTGSAAETSPMGRYLAARGMAVQCPLLPGHGTSPEDLTRIRWQAWAGEVEAALEALRERCEEVFVGGLSLGSLLALWLAHRHPHVAGLIAMAPAIKLQTRLLPLTLGLRRVWRYNPLGPVGDDDLSDPESSERVWCYDQTPLWGAGEVYLLQRRVRRALPAIRQPILIFQGRRDGQLDPGAAQLLYDRIGSADKTLVWLENSGHNILADGERESVWEQSHRWICERAGGGRP